MGTDSAAQMLNIGEQLLRHPSSTLSVIDSTVLIHDLRGDILCREDITYTPTPGATPRVSQATGEKGSAARTTPMPGS